MSRTQPAPGWLQPVTDYVPLTLFLIAYLTADILTATAVLIGATLLALILSYSVARKVPVLALLAAGVVAVFGGLTLFFEDDLFIKIKPTIVQILFAVVLYGSYLFGRPVLKLVLGTAFPLKEEAWRPLTIRFSVFFLIMAAANEVIWRTQSTDFWVAFDTIGQIVITFAFMMTQVPFLLRHQLEEGNGAETQDS
ncbi:septation protein A [Fodinicurvata sediminis]|uniref:septation protein A n=1 Tax=Fodinicurvata sediminis TaxID=1121832 RepID=UPI00138B10BA|nr:septation protein A [Fodinicurvata sediminis]